MFSDKKVIAESVADFCAGADEGASGDDHELEGGAVNQYSFATCG